MVCAAEIVSSFAGERILIVNGGKKLIHVRTVRIQTAQLNRNHHIFLSARKLVQNTSLSVCITHPIPFGIEEINDNTVALHYASHRTCPPIPPGKLQGCRTKRTRNVGAKVQYTLLLQICCDP